MPARAPLRAVVYVRQWLSDPIVLHTQPTAYPQPEPPASAIVTLLSHHVPNVHCAAVKALGNLGRSALASHAGAIAGLLIYTVFVARCTAVEFLARTHNIFRDNYANEIVDRYCAIGAMRTLCMRVSAIRRWRNVRAYVIRRWLLNWWVERATRPKYAPGGCVFVLTQEDAMSLFEE